MKNGQICYYELKNSEKDKFMVESFRCLNVIINFVMPSKLRLLILKSFRTHSKV